MALHLDIPMLIVNANSMIQNKIVFNKIFEENKNVSERKKAIKTVMISYINDSLKCLNSTLYLMQNIQDYFVILLY